MDAVVVVSYLIVVASQKNLASSDLFVSRVLLEKGGICPEFPPFKILLIANVTPDCPEPKA